MPDTLFPYGEPPVSWFPGQQPAAPATQVQPPMPAAKMQPTAPMTQMQPMSAAQTQLSPPTVTQIQPTGPAAQMQPAATGPAPLISRRLTSQNYMAGMLTEFAGYMVTLEVIFGTAAVPEHRTGILRKVGLNYVILESALQKGEVQVLDLYSIKAATIYISPNETIYY